MKKQIKYTIGIILVIGIVIAGLMIFSNKTPTNTDNNKEGNNSVLLPVSTGPEGFIISNAIVENNEDPVTKQPVDDHLEITLKNSIDKDLSNITVDYAILDPKTNKNESYHVLLDNFILKSKETQIIHFDNQNATNHFWVNKYSMYYLSQDPLKFTVTVSTPGYKSQNIVINKDAGGAEQAD